MRTMVNGTERAPGLLGIWPRDRKPELRLSRDDPHLRCWNGAKIQLFAAQKADRFRGANSDGGWGDELDYWRPERMSPAEAFSDFRFGIRTGDDPRIVLTTTPRRGGLVSQLIGKPGVVVTRASMLDNASNLAPEFIADAQANSSERIWRQEGLGELLSNVEGAIVSPEMLDQARVDQAPELRRVAIGVDPYGGGGDACGIAAAGIGVDGFGYLLADRTCKGGPDFWGRRVIETYLEFDASVLAVERNYGGDMAISVISHAAEKLGVSRPRFAGKKGRGITATKSKPERFERTTAAKYERGELRHAGRFPELEDEVTQFTPQAYEGSGSPNRADSLILAVEELFPVRARVGWGDVIATTEGGTNGDDA